MKFKTDENLPSEVVDHLRLAGFDAMTVVERRLSGAPDARVAAVCHDEGRVLVTLDLDFADIRAHPPGTGPASSSCDHARWPAPTCWLSRPR
jgi:predicted nuclease of predicted toxin-antitoxin system